MTQHSIRDARLRKHADYQRVYQSSRKQHSPSMTWFYSPQPELNAQLSANSTEDTKAIPVSRPFHTAPTGSRVGITAGKVLGKAHERNRIKRRMREAIRLHLDKLCSGVDVILHPRRSVMTMEYAKLEAEVAKIFAQITRMQTTKPAPESKA